MDEERAFFPEEGNDWSEMEKEFNLFPEEDEYNDQTQKREYDYSRENWDWQKIEEMPDFVFTKSGKKIKNFKKIEMMKNFNK